MGFKAAMAQKPRNLQALGRRWPRNIAICMFFYAPGPEPFAFYEVTESSLVLIGVALIDLLV
eukprot:8249641-Karenia_brevis.AAC.1